MPALSDILASIDDALAGAAASGYSSRSNSSDIYEGYIWSLVVRAAKEHGGVVVYENGLGSRVTSLTFRASPGSIFSQPALYSHAAISFGSRPVLEAHIGIRVFGRSKILHECDVVVLPKAEADSCRRQSVHPRSSSVLVAAECKFYSSTLPLGLGRGFVGLTGEIHRKGRYLVSSSSAGGIRRMLSYHSLEWEEDVVPKSRSAEDLKTSLRRVFRNYCSI